MEKGKRYKSKCTQFLSDEGGAYTILVEKDEILEFSHCNYNFVLEKAYKVKSVALYNNSDKQYKYVLESQFNMCFENCDYLM